MLKKIFFLNILFGWARPSLWYVGSSSLTKDQISGPLHCKQGVLATGAPGKSLVMYVEISLFPNWWNQKAPMTPLSKGMVYLKGVGLCWYLEELLITSPISPPHSHYHPTSGDWVKEDRPHLSAKIHPEFCLSDMWLGQDVKCWPYPCPYWLVSLPTEDWGK